MLGGLLALFAVNCNAAPNFFGFPTWYKYINLVDVNGSCELPDSFGIKDTPLIGLAAVDILLRLAGLIAVGYIIYGGIQFVIAQGEADKLKKARQTIINALVGLALAMVSVGIVSFVGARIAG